MSYPSHLPKDCLDILLKYQQDKKSKTQEGEKQGNGSGNGDIEWTVEDWQILSRTLESHLKQLDSLITL